MKPFSHWAQLIEQCDISAMINESEGVEKSLIDLTTQVKNAAHAKELAIACGQYSFFYKAFESSDDRFDSLYLALAQACSRHMDPEDLFQAYLSMTTEVSGPSTYAITMGYLNAVKKSGQELPSAILKYGRYHHPWVAFISDFASEFDRNQAHEIASALSDLGYKHPTFILNSMIEASFCLEACMGCIRHSPAICHYDDAAFDIDTAAREAKRHGVDDTLHVELFALSLESGMPLKLSMLEYICVPELLDMSVAWLERLALLQEIREHDAPRKNTMSL